MTNDALTKFLQLAQDHYWDSFEKDRNIILAHINQLAIRARKQVCDNKDCECDPENEYCYSCAEKKGIDI